MTGSVEPIQPGRIARRPAAAADASFLFELYATTRVADPAFTGWSAAELDSFLRMQFDAQCRYYAARFPDAAFEVIEQNGRPIGRLTVHESSEAVRIVDIALLPDARGQGVGAALMRAVMHDAAGRSKPVVLHVDHHSRAQRLYARLGFERDGESGPYLAMRWRPPAS